MTRRTLATLRAALPPTAIAPTRPRPNTMDFTLPDGTRIIRLYDTDVLRFYADGSIDVSTGGLNTHTTVDRINAFLPSPYRVGRDRGAMLLFGCGGKPVRFDRSVTIPAAR